MQIIAWDKSRTRTGEEIWLSGNQKTHLVTSRVSCKLLSASVLSRVREERVASLDSFLTLIVEKKKKEKKWLCIGFSRETEPIGYIVIGEEKFIMRIGSHDRGDWAVSWQAVWELEDKECWWYNSIWGQRMVSPVSHSIQGQAPGALIPMSQGRKDRCLGSRREPISSSSTFLFRSSPQWIGRCLPIFTSMNLFYSIYRVRS